MGQLAPKTKTSSSFIERNQIIRTVMDFIEYECSKHISVADLASAANISERTLRSAFKEYFGMGPARFLKLRRLNLVHDTLQDSDPSVTTVTCVAYRFGVWELGRLAHDYQNRYGESPSETLRRLR